MSAVAQAPMSAAEVLDRLDARTRSILEHRHRLASPRRRGWLVRRMLLAADLFGLVLAFVTADAVLGSRGGGDYVSLASEFLVFFLT